MAKLNVEAFSEEFRKTAPMKCATYLYECLSENEKQQIKENWNEAGGYKVIPWWEWCMNHIDVNYSK